MIKALGEGTIAGALVGRSVYTVATGVVGTVAMVLTATVLYMSLLGMSPVLVVAGAAVAPAWRRRVRRAAHETSARS